MTATAFAAPSGGAEEPDDREREGAPLAPASAMPTAWDDWLRAARVAFESALGEAGPEDAGGRARDPWDGFARRHVARVEADAARLGSEYGADAVAAALAEQSRAAADLERRARVAGRRRRLDRSLLALTERAGREPQSLERLIEEASGLVARARPALARGEDAEALRRWGEVAARAGARRAATETPRAAVRLISSAPVRRRLDAGERARLVAVARARAAEDEMLDAVRETEAFGADRARLRRGDAARIDLDAWVEQADDADERRRRVSAASTEAAARAEALADHERWVAVRWSPEEADGDERLADERRAQKERLAADPAAEAWAHPRLVAATARLAASDAVVDGALGIVIAEGLALQERLGVPARKRMLLPRRVAARIAQALTEAATPMEAIRRFVRSVESTAQGRLVDVAGELSDAGLPAPLAVLLLDAFAPAAAARLERVERAWIAGTSSEAAPERRGEERTKAEAAALDALSRSVLGAALDAHDEPASARVRAQMAAYAGRLASTLEPMFGTTAATEALRLLVGDLAEAPVAPVEPPAAANDNEPDASGDSESPESLLDDLSAAVETLRLSDGPSFEQVDSINWLPAIAKALREWLRRRSQPPQRPRPEEPEPPPVVPPPRSPVGPRSGAGLGEFLRDAEGSFSPEGAEAFRARQAEILAEIKRRFFPDRVPAPLTDDHLLHTYAGSIGGKPLRPTGLHHQPDAAPDLTDRGFHVVEVDATRADGVYRAKVYAWDESSGKWIEKRSFSAFFPRHWTPVDLAREMEPAIASVPAGFDGELHMTTRSGIPVTLIVTRGKVTEFYPKW